MGFSAYLVSVLRTSDTGTDPGGVQDDDTGIWDPNGTDAGAAREVLPWVEADVQEQGTSLVRQQSADVVANADATIFVRAYRMGRIQTILRLLREGDIVQVQSRDDGVTRECELVRARAMDGTLYVKYLGAAALP